MAIQLRQQTKSRMLLRPPGRRRVSPGNLFHALDQAVAFRAGPVPILVTKPAVAVLAYFHNCNASYQRLAALLAWGVVTSAAAVVAFSLLTANDYLPRNPTRAELVAIDFGMFL